MNPNTMTTTATTEMARKIVICIQILRVMRMSGPLVELVGRNERISRRVWTRHLADGPAPLQLQFGELALEASSRQQASVEATQREVDDGGQIPGITAQPLRQRGAGEREG